jgi:hypothetical protein
MATVAPCGKDREEGEEGEESEAGATLDERGRAVSERSIDRFRSEPKRHCPGDENRDDIARHKHREARCNPAGMSANSVGPPFAEGGTSLQSRVSQNSRLRRSKWGRGENHGVRVVIEGQRLASF